MQVLYRFSIFLSSCVLLLSWSKAEAETRLALTAGSSYSNLSVGNLDGDNSNGLEIVAASADGNVRAYLNSGELLWQSQTPNANCGTNGNRVHSSPALGDLNRDGALDVIIGYGGVGSDHCDGGVVAFNGKTGAEMWRFSVQKWAKTQHYGARWSTVFATPAVADVDRDGNLEIAFGGFDRSVYLLNSNGSVRWYYIAADTVWSSPAFTDINGDGKLELIAATDISQNKAINPPTKNGGMIYAFKTAKRKSQRIGFRDKSAYFWQNSFDQVPYSSPVIADVLKSSKGAEIVIGSGCYFHGTGNWIKILSATSGKLLRTIRTGGCSTTSVAVGDIRGDGSLLLAHLEPGAGGDTYLVAYDPNSGARIWSSDVGHGDSSFQAPIIADIDANGSPEVIVAHASSVMLFEGATGKPLNCISSACREGELRVGGDVSRATPTVADLDGDGVPELLVNTSGGTGKIVIWRDLANIFQTVATQRVGQIKTWPTWRGSSSRSGS